MNLHDYQVRSLQSMLPKNYIQSQDELKMYQELIFQKMILRLTFFEQNYHDAEEIDFNVKVQAKLYYQQINDGELEEDLSTQCDSSIDYMSASNFSDTENLSEDEQESKQQNIKKVKKKKTKNRQIQKNKVKQFSQIKDNIKDEQKPIDQSQNLNIDQQEVDLKRIRQQNNKLRILKLVGAGVVSLATIGGGIACSMSPFGVIVGGSLIGGGVSSLINVIQQAWSGKDFDCSEYMKTKGMGMFSGFLSGGLSCICSSLMGGIMTSFIGQLTQTAVSGTVGAVAGAVGGQLTRNISNKLTQGLTLLKQFYTKAAIQITVATIGGGVSGAVCSYVTKIVENLYKGGEIEQNNFVYLTTLKIQNLSQQDAIELWTYLNEEKIIVNKKINKQFEQDLKLPSKFAIHKTEICILLSECLSILNGTKQGNEVAQEIREGRDATTLEAKAFAKTHKCNLIIYDENDKVLTEIKGPEGSTETKYLRYYAHGHYEALDNNMKIIPIESADGDCFYAALQAEGSIQELRNEIADNIESDIFEVLGEASFDELRDKGYLKGGRKPKKDEENDNKKNGDDNWKQKSNFLKEEIPKEEGDKVGKVIKVTYQNLYDMEGEDSQRYSNAIEEIRDYINNLDDRSTNTRSIVVVEEFLNHKGQIIGERVVEIDPRTLYVRGVDSYYDSDQTQHIRINEGAHMQNNGAYHYLDDPNYSSDTNNRVDAVRNFAHYARGRSDQQRIDQMGQYWAEAVRFEEQKNHIVDAFDNITIDNDSYMDMFRSDWTTEINDNVKIGQQ
eukprot:403359838